MSDYRHLPPYNSPSPSFSKPSVHSTPPKPRTVAHLEVVVPATLPLDELRHRLSGFQPWLETIISDQDRKHDTRITITVAAEPPAAAYLHTLTIPKESTP